MPRIAPPPSAAPPPALAPPGGPGLNTPSGLPLLLAPMEGLLDWRLRDVLTRVGGIDRCVSEFIRVTDQLLPARVFYRLVPELRHGSRTPAGVPVRPQLLGSDPACLADNAARLAALGAEGVDLNFGCPAKTVNRHRGGAVLLDEPELVHAIVAAVRQAVPAHLPVSAKMRLGNEDHARAAEVAQGIEAAGANELVVHGRTKRQGYKPPAFWDEIARVRAAVRLRVVANGEVWTAADARRCLAESGCDALMLGRGMVADPGLALAVRQGWATPSAALAEAGPLDAFEGAGLHVAAAQAADTADTAAGPVHGLPWADVCALFARYAELVADGVAPRHQAGRLKQWLSLLRRRYPEAQAAHERLRLLDDPQALVVGLACA